MDWIELRRAGELKLMLQSQLGANVNTCPCGVLGTQVGQIEDEIQEI
jgi:hypothetical protein